MESLDAALDLFRRGRSAEAEAMAERLLAAATDRCPALTLLAEIRAASGRPSAAIVHWRELARLSPRDAANLRRLGQALISVGRPDEAVQPLERALRLEPGNVRGLNHLGQALLQLGRHREAIGFFERAVALQPDYGIGLANLALTAERLGRVAQALEISDRLVGLQPSDPNALLRRARLRWRLNRAADAWNDLEAVSAIRPLDAEAGALSAAVLLALSRPTAALAAADAVLARFPDSAEVLQYRAAALCQLQRHAEAVPCLERALELAPADVDAWCNCAILQQQLGDSAAAAHSYRQALARDPGHFGARCGLVAAMIPPVPESIVAALHGRDRFEREMEALEGWIATHDITEADAWTLAGQHFFYLSYQELSNKELLLRYRRASAARLTGYAQPSRSFSPRRPAARYRLGIVSAQVFDHSVFNAMTRGWLETLDRGRFEITLFSLAQRRDPATELAEGSVEHFESRAKTVPEWARLIHGEGLDAVLYPEVGIDRNTLALANLRLAPRQLAAWGHPETTGLPTIDEFLSADAFEPADADGHYSERLVRLPNLGVFYRPYAVPPAPIDRAALGIASDVPLLICPGTPFKYHPRDDAVLVEIARRLGACRFVFFTYERPALSRRLGARLAAAFVAAGLDPERYLVWIPWQSRESFLGLLACAHVYLDTLRFSGFNTLMQAVEMGLPCVSHEGLYLRGRLGSGILRTLDIPELIAEDHASYVEIAVRLASDSVYRDAIAARMRLAAPRTYADRGAVQALERTLLR
jgi:predicted O-linked N-acetylglucosamine transferase (SPINDLY family)